METHLLELRTLFCTEGMALFLGSLIPIHPTPLGAIFCYSQLARISGIPTFPSMSNITCLHVPCLHLPMNKITCLHLPMMMKTCLHLPMTMMTCQYQPMRKMASQHQPIGKPFFPWQNTSAIVSMSAPLKLILIISFLLASSFRSMSVKLGLLQSKSALVSSNTFRASSGQIFIRVWLMLL